MADPAAYPDRAAGHRGIDTSIAGADHIAEALPRLQGIVCSIIQAAGPYGATGDEIAGRLGWDKYRVRPRTAELRALGKIMDSGVRRKSLAGVNSIVWVSSEHVRCPSSLTEARS